MNEIKEIPVKFKVLPTSFVGKTALEIHRVLYTNFAVN